MHYFRYDKGIEEIINSVEDKVGASDIPDMVTAYSETSYNLDQRGMVANLGQYLTTEELHTLITMGVDYVQGYYLGKPNFISQAVNAEANIEIQSLQKNDELILC